MPEQFHGELTALPKAGDLSGDAWNTLLFQPTDSIATNLLRYSSQLHLPPLAELYILSGSHIIQAERTGIENGLHHEPHLRILLRCRGGMRGGTRGFANGSSGGKDRGNRASEGNARGLGGGHTNVENSHTPQMKGEMGRGREYRTPDPRRSTIIHTQPQEAIDENSRYALMVARRETLRTTTDLYCYH